MMNSPSPASALLEFAGDFIHPIDHYSEVRTELLAESFRQSFGLPPFPSFDDLWQLGGRLGIHLSRPPTMPPALPGANVWHGASPPNILLNPDLSPRFAETTLCHELREVIEIAFKRVKPSYLGLDTADNRAMNPESDQFGGCLLMQADAARLRLRNLGFDFPAFADAIGRSLSSVVLRSQQLYSSASPEPGPVAGVWLFEAPWETVEAGRSTAVDLKARYVAHLSGFSARKHGTAEQSLARSVFPTRGAVASTFRIAVDAIEQGRPVFGYLPGFDLFGERDFVVGAEPFFLGASPWRVLLMAVRRDGESQIEPWVNRLSGGFDLQTLESF